MRVFLHHQIVPRARPKQSEERFNQTQCAFFGLVPWFQKDRWARPWASTHRELLHPRKAVPVSTAIAPSGEFLKELERTAGRGRHPRSSCGGSGKRGTAMVFSNRKKGQTISVWTCRFTQRIRCFRPKLRPMLRPKLQPKFFRILKKHFGWFQLWRSGFESDRSIPWAPETRRKDPSPTWANW